MSKRNSAFIKKKRSEIHKIIIIPRALQKVCTKLKAVITRILLGIRNSEEFHVKVAETLDEACKLVEVGFEYVTDMDGNKLFRKRK